MNINEDIDNIDGGKEKKKRLDLGGWVEWRMGWF